MSKKSFLKIQDFSSNEILDLLVFASELKNKKDYFPLLGKVVALLFEKPSLRTRVSFEVGVRQLGGECVYLSPSDVGLGTREPVSDVIRVLDRWVDIVVSRVFEHQVLDEMNRFSNIPIINALSDLEHPCQAMADLLTIKQHKKDFKNLSVAFIGDGNNVSASLSIACASVGANFAIATPDGFELPKNICDESINRSLLSGSKISFLNDPVEAVSDADVVYTDVWVSMGDEQEESKRLKAFKDFQVNEDLMKHAKTDAIFMHDMPAHRGLEISDSMIDCHNSVVFDQAENRLHAQKAIMAFLFKGEMI